MAHARHGSGGGQAPIKRPQLKLQFRYGSEPEVFNGRQIFGYISPFTRLLNKFCLCRNVHSYIDRTCSVVGGVL